MSRLTENERNFYEAQSLNYRLEYEALDQQKSPLELARDYPGDDCGPLGLTCTQFKLLRCLQKHPNGRSNSQLMDAVYWNSLEPPDDQIIKVMISFIRKKLVKAGSKCTIETVHGQGYIYHPSIGRYASIWIGGKEVKIPQVDVKDALEQLTKFQEST